MNTSLSWIKAYVPDLDVTPQEYRDAMTLTGTKVETVEILDKNLEKIVIGQIKEIKPHPDANKLVICQVDIGTETIQIVTGASNMKEQDKVAVVLDGGKVAGGHDGGPMPEDGIRIKAGALRGVESYGMMCSIEELGSSREFYPEAPEEGLYIFPEDAEVGADAIEALGLHDATIEYEITSNRVDCYSVIGIAREAAATFRKPFHPPVVKETGNGEDINDYLKVTVEDTDLCKRYCARMVKNIKLAPSPKWMQRRLAANGIRPINNIVDITNYIMEEYGQPMHAFDYDLIAGHHIIVKRANDGDTFQTLDGQIRNMDHDVLMINDAEKAVGIAGIMGGENSKITDDVKTMVFECACFDGTNNRLSSRRLGLRTDASGKYEKGLDPNTAEEAVNRACQLVEELGAGEVVGGIIDIYPVKAEGNRVAFEPEKINHLLGTDIDAETMKSYFKMLDLGFDEATQEVVVPSWRQDLHCMNDLAEEVARFYGYDKIPTTLPGAKTAGRISFEKQVEDVCREVAEFCGFSESMTYSFESPKVFDKLLLAADAPERNAITIANPLGEDFSIMRTMSLNGMLTSLATNANRRNKNVHLYEMANIYLPKALPLTELPDERMTLTLGFYDEKEDFFDLKGVVEELLSTMGMNEKLSYDANAGRPYLHPGRQANIIYNGKVLGFIGEVHPLVRANYNLGERTYIAVIDMPQVVEQASFDRKYTPITNFPASTRDLSLLTKKDMEVGEIEAVFDREGGQYLESYELFDVYVGAGIDPDYKSVAYSLTFRAKDKNLADTDVNEAMDRIINGLSAIDVNMRS